MNRSKSSYRRRVEGSWASEGGGKRAIIDIGSNTVRMVVYGGSHRAPQVLANEKVTARLGRGLADTGRMSDESIALAMAGLGRFALILRDLDITDVETVATAAVRDAANGAEFLAGVEALGLGVRLISGEEEARTSAYGVIGAFPRAVGVVADLGGGSLELISVSGDEPGRGTTLPLGSLRLAALREAGDEKFHSRVGKALKNAGWKEPCGGTLYLVGGTWRTMAILAMRQQGHPLSDPHGLEIDAATAMKLARRTAKTSSEALKAIPRVSTMRSLILPDAAALLVCLLKLLQPERLVFSAWGLREGLLYDRLEPVERAQDPLLAGISLFAGQHGAPPMLATRVAAWTVDGSPQDGEGSERLRLASTMLALASLQVEPNLRLQQAVDWALYKRWLAIDDVGRAMMAATILANGGTTELPTLLTDLAPQERLDEALTWGLAIRLCRRIGLQSRKSLLMTRLRAENGILRLAFHESHAALATHPAPKDLKNLADRLGLEPKIEVLGDAAFSAIRDNGMHAEIAAA
ncbi:Ppx/GppA family phosphatase [Croceicoccus bisphenolivorans]|uniref:Ppx/GppA family phosphatase n=1 Tax=Croceicoccus bisphenolivorans TaxID=1783232 RepID=UPI000A8C24FE|nr:Ppx/GppA family phosphatase [Croceicoccus bisphenolivorans]